jgi:hypothetical protein
VGGLSEGGNFTSEDVDFGLRAMVTPASLPGSYRATPRPQQGSDCEQVAPWRGRASRGGGGRGCDGLQSLPKIPSGPDSRREAEIIA